MAEALLDTLNQALDPIYFTRAHKNAWSHTMAYFIGQMASNMIIEKEMSNKTKEII